MAFAHGGLVIGFAPMIVWLVSLSIEQLQFQIIGRGCYGTMFTIPFPSLPLLPIVLLIQLVPMLRFFFCGFPNQNPTEVFWAGADKLGVLLYSRQADRQVEAQLKTLGSRHVRYKTVQTVNAI